MRFRLIPAVPAQPSALATLLPLRRVPTSGELPPRSHSTTSRSATATIARRRCRRRPGRTSPSRVTAASLRADRQRRSPMCGRLPRVEASLRPVLLHSVPSRTSGRTLLLGISGAEIWTWISMPRRDFLLTMIATLCLQSHRLHTSSDLTSVEAKVLGSSAQQPLAEGQLPGTHSKGILIGKVAMPTQRSMAASLRRLQHMLRRGRARGLRALPIRRH
mmetsp:Transcript_80939/g.232563  ORF Transcript_80939/g.232563 Transcript_80939/m.232563 type:complete len:218 (-) Transcript_80939:502-1155(-)